MSLKDRLEENGSLNNYLKEEYSLSQIDNSNVITWIHIDDLNVITNQPFKEYTNSIRYQSLRESIKNFEITNPLIIRKVNNKYFILSGRHRYLVAKELKFEKVPCIVKTNITDDEANLILLDSNLCQREELLPSEKAFSYKEKRDILSRQGKRSDLFNSEDNGIETSEIIAKSMNTNRSEVLRYIRLTYLIEPILNLVDNRKISFSVAYALSFLSHSEQHIVYNLISSKKVVIKTKTANSLKKLSQNSSTPLDENIICKVVLEDRNNSIKTQPINSNTSFKDLYTIYLKDYFNDSTSTREALSLIEIALKEYFSNH